MYYVGVLILYLCFKYFRSKYQLNSLKEVAEYEIYKIMPKINDGELNPMYRLRLGTVYMGIGNLEAARKYPTEAQSLINEGHQLYVDKILLPTHEGEPALLSNQDKMYEQIQLSIRYTEKPLPWSKKVAHDYSNSALFFMLVKGFGNKRFNF